MRKTTLKFSYLFSLICIIASCEKSIINNNENNVSVLMYALNANRKDVALLLIEKSADVNSIDIRGQTPLDYTLYEYRVFNDSVNEVQLMLIKYGAQYGNSIREQYADRVRVAFTRIPQK